MYFLHGFENDVWGAETPNRRHILRFVAYFQHLPELQKCGENPINQHWAFPPTRITAGPFVPRVKYVSESPISWDMIAGLSPTRRRRAGGFQAEDMT